MGMFKRQRFGVVLVDVGWDRIVLFRFMFLGIIRLLYKLIFEPVLLYGYDLFSFSLIQNFKFSCFMF